MSVKVEDVFTERDYLDFLNCSKEAMEEVGLVSEMFEQRILPFHGKQISFDTLFTRETMMIDIEVRIKIEVNINIGVSGYYSTKIFDASWRSGIEHIEGKMIEDEVAEHIEKVKKVAVGRLEKWLKQNL